MTQLSATAAASGSNSRSQNATFAQVVSYAHESSDLIVEWKQAEEEPSRISEWVRTAPDSLSIPDMDDSYEGFSKALLDLVKVWAPAASKGRRVSTLTQKWFAETKPITSDETHVVATNYIVGFIQHLRPVWDLKDLFARSEEGMKHSASYIAGARDCIGTVMAEAGLILGQRKEDLKVCFSAWKPEILIEKWKKLSPSTESSEAMTAVMYGLCKIVARTVARNKESYQKVAKDVMVSVRAMLIKCTPIIKVFTKGQKKAGNNQADTRTFTMKHRTPAVTGNLQMVCNISELATLKTWNEFARMDTWKDAKFENPEDAVETCRQVARKMANVGSAIGRVMKARKTEVWRAASAISRKVEASDMLKANAEVMKKYSDGNQVAEIIQRFFKVIPSRADHKSIEWLNQNYILENRQEEDDEEEDS